MKTNLDTLAATGLKIPVADLDQASGGLFLPLPLPIPFPIPFPWPFPFPFPTF